MSGDLIGNSVTIIASLLSLLLSELLPLLLFGELMCPKVASCMYFETGGGYAKV